MKYLKTPQFTDCISEINNTEIDHAKDTDVVMGMYKLKYYSDNIQKHLEVHGNTIEMNQLCIIMALLLIFQMILIVLRLNLNKETGQTENYLKCLSNFWKTLEMPLINCEINIF